jgi:hypothetical protein
MKKECRGSRAITSRKNLSLIFSLVFLLFVFLIMYAPLIQAVESEDVAIPQVYSWLINKTKRWNTLGINESAFSLLALKCNETFVKQGNKSLYNLSYYNSTQKIRCWSNVGQANKNNCRIMDTALAKLALNEIQENTTYVDNWLLSNKRIFTKDIYWYLQIDAQLGKEVSCEVMYQDSMQNLTVFANKTVAKKGGTGDCIEGVHKNYWFKIKNTEACYNNIYSIKCFGNESDAGSVTATLLYNNNSDDKKLYFSVSSEIVSGAVGYVNILGDEIVAPDVMELNIPSYCLGTNQSGQGICDYEGTAWATFVWMMEGKQEYVNMFTPYLVVYSSNTENQKYFPESFLSKIIGGDYTDKLVKEQQRIRKPQTQPAAYWSFWLKQPLLYGQFYDTPKAALALADSTPNIEEIRDYLLNRLSKDHSWKNEFDTAPSKDTIRDTAFILWVFWGSYCPGAGGTQGAECEQQGLNFGCQDSCLDLQIMWPFNCPSGLVCCENTTSNPDACIDNGGMCTAGISCPTGSGQLSEIVSCPNDQPLCCKTYTQSQCSDFGRRVCDSYLGEYCQNNETVETSDGQCCLSSCITDNPQTSCYSQNGYVCLADEICWSSALGDQVPFIPALEDTCCPSPSECIKDEVCSYVGKDCSSTEQGYGPEYSCVSGTDPGQTTRTKDVAECCLNDCKKGCAPDKICTESQVCQGNQWAQDSVEDNCCLSECKAASKGGSLWWIIIIIIVVVALILVYFFVIKKKKGKKEELDEFGFPKKGEGPSEGDEFSDFESAMKAETMSGPSKKEDTFGKKSSIPIFKSAEKSQIGTVPRPTLQSLKNKPAAEYKVPANLFSTRVIPRQMPTSRTKPHVERTVTKTVTKTTVKAAGKKTKDEDDFEEVLGKLKKISKK